METAALSYSGANFRLETLTIIFYASSLSLISFGMAFHYLHAFHPMNLILLRGEYIFL